jgi:hypothetical protein
MVLSEEVTVVESGDDLCVDDEDVERPESERAPFSFALLL